MLTAEADEKFDKFVPWLNENNDPNILQSYEERGLKDGAPEEVKAIYAEFLAMVEQCRKDHVKF